MALQSELYMCNPPSWPRRAFPTLIEIGELKAQHRLGDDTALDLVGPAIDGSGAAV
jgi:hypothetical protein